MGVLWTARASIHARERLRITRSRRLTQRLLAIPRAGVVSTGTAAFARTGCWPEQIVDVCVAVPVAVLVLLLHLVEHEPKHTSIDVVEGVQGGTKLGAPDDAADHDQCSAGDVFQDGGVGDRGQRGVSRITTS